MKIFAISHRNIFCFLLFFIIVIQTAKTQSVDVGKMTQQERQAYLSKIRMSSIEARNKMLGQLHIQLPLLPPDSTDPNRPTGLSKRSGTNNWYDKAGNMYVRSDWGIWSNYDEAKTGSYTLPDPLLLKNGQKVTNANIWWQKRRPEILNDFRTEVYGKTPEHTPKVTFEVTELNMNAASGKAIMKKIVGHIDNSKYSGDAPQVEITLYVPAKVKTPVPLIVRVSSPFDVVPSNNNNQEKSATEQVLDMGWAYATVNTYAVQADNGAGLTEGIIGLVNEGKERKPDDWGVLAAWSWGMSRALDYFETDKMIDGKQIAIQGHSRWGKTALLAAALDQRWAMVFASCSGSMGASLEKRDYGENIDNVAGSGEYHWMAGNFLKYGGHWNNMPVDAHELIALVAPRPVFITGGTQDLWADPHGEFLACVAAEPVYRLLGKKGLGTANMPAPDVSLIAGDLAFREHEGGHTDTLDWPVFLQFAQKYFKVRTAASK